MTNAINIQANISVYKPAIAFIFVVVILLLKPYGLLGRKE